MNAGNAATGGGGLSGMLQGPMGMLSKLGGIGATNKLFAKGIYGAKGGALLLGGGILAADGLRRGGVKGMFERASRSPHYAEAVRARIRAGGIVKRLEDHVLGKVEMSATQVSAALGLLRKCVPDLSTVEHSGPGGGPIDLQMSPSDVARRYAFLLAKTAVEKAAESSKEKA